MKSIWSETLCANCYKCKHFEEFARCKHNAMRALYERWVQTKEVQSCQFFDANNDEEV